MVVMRWPTAADTGVTQERTAASPMCTVQAPQSPAPQPNLVPIMPSSSRSAQSSGMSAGTSTLTFRLLISSVIMLLYVLWVSQLKSSS